MILKFNILIFVPNEINNLNLKCSLRFGKYINVDIIIIYIYMYIGFKKGV